MVSVAYELTVDGQVADKATADKPLKFLFGTGMLLPKFEEAIYGKEVGDVVEFTLEPKDGYGEIQPKQTIDFPKSDFFVDGSLPEEAKKFLVPGGMIPLYTQAGQMVPGTIVEVGDTVVKIEVDVNHPMAGKTLNFKVEVVEVREPSEEEMAPKGCGCGCHCGEEGHEGCHCGDEHDDCNCHCEEGGCDCSEHEHDCGCDSCHCE